MASITLRSLKGSPLTITEMDDNFSNVNTELGTKLDITSYTASDILTKLKTVDGASSGLDADLLDGLSPSTSSTANSIVVRDSAGSITSNSFIGDLTGDVTGNVSGTSSDITSILSITKGGTGANNVTTALDNLLPAGEQAGYVLKTSGAGSYFWGAQTGNVTTAGTRVDSTRIITTATAGQTLFTAPTYVAGANQLRVYIDGVRQFDSEYTETSTTSFTLLTGVSAGTIVLAEVDGYIEYDTAASEVSYSPTGTLTSTNVQDAIDEVNPYTIPSGGIILWSGSVANIPSGWALCDGTNSTPDLRNKFVVGGWVDGVDDAMTTVTGGGTKSGGSKDAIVPSHSHTYDDKYIDQMQQATSQSFSSLRTIPYSSSGSWSGYMTTGRDDGGNRGIRLNGKIDSASVSTTGSSVTNANLPPYYALAYIMKL